MDVQFLYVKYQMPKEKGNRIIIELCFISFLKALSYLKVSVNYFNNLRKKETP